MVKFTVSGEAVEPVRVTVNCPGSAGSPAFGSLAVMVTVGSAGALPRQSRRWGSTVLPDAPSASPSRTRTTPPMS